MSYREYNNFYNKNLRKFAGENRKHSTLSEYLLWNEILKARKLGYQFHRQRLVLNYIGDFFCKELMLFVETDGSSHEDGKVKVKDKIKEKELNEKGYTILRFTDNDVAGDIDGTRSRIEQWIKDYEERHPEVLQYKIRGKRKVKGELK